MEQHTTLNIQKLFKNGWEKGISRFLAKLCICYQEQILLMQPAYTPNLACPYDLLSIHLEARDTCEELFPYIVKSMTGLEVSRIDPCIYSSIHTSAKGPQTQLVVIPVIVDAADSIKLNSQHYRDANWIKEQELHRYPLTIEQLEILKNYWTASYVELAEV
ncbi:MAG: hypothetical protein K0S74_185 [Chlamydiales bacterium]|jgi:hypothetical protein|nr:hypothetical protein [Chlamydiales bacterium]